MAKITLLGMKSFNPNLFNGLSVPAGLDRKALINNILLKGADFEVIYPDPDFLQEAIGNWSIIHQKTFEKWMKAYNIDWNPIENYDRYEESTDNGTNNMTAHDTNHSTGHGTNQLDRSAFDAGDYSLDNKATSNTSGDSTTDMQSSGANKNEHKAHIHGNIGVTQSSEMYLSYNDAALWNIYEEITNLFLRDFVIPVF